MSAETMKKSDVSHVTVAPLDDTPTFTTIKIPLTMVDNAMIGMIDD